MLVASGDAVNNLLEGAVVNVEGNTGDTSGGREGSEVGVDLGLMLRASWRETPGADSRETCFSKVLPMSSTLEAGPDL